MKKFSKRENEEKLNRLRHEACAHRVPENRFGFVVHHTKTNKPISSDRLSSFYHEVLGPIHEDLLNEARKEFGK